MASKKKGSPEMPEEKKPDLKTKKGDDKPGAEDEDLGDEGAYAGRDACGGCSTEKH